MPAGLLQLFLDAYQGATGFVPRRVAREWRCMCPVHELDGVAHNPSMAVWARPDGSVAFHCMGGTCAHREVAARLKAMGINVPVPTDAQREVFKQQHALNREAKLREAQRAFESSREITPVDAAYVYLNSRCIDPTQDELRFLRTNKDGTELIGLLSQPSTLFDPTILLRGVSILRLHHDGTAKLNASGKKWRGVSGLLKGNGVVLGQWHHEMVLGEGIETTLAAMRLLKKSFGVAGCIANNVLDVEPPAGVTHLFVAVDNDFTGRTISQRVAEKRRAQSFDVTLCKWGREGDDAADEWRRRNMTIPTRERETA